MSDRNNYAGERLEGTWTVKIKRNRVEVTKKGASLRGTSYCHPDDTFDFTKGVEKAMIRALAGLKFNKTYVAEAKGVSAKKGTIVFTLKDIVSGELYSVEASNIYSTKVN